MKKFCCSILAVLMIFALCSCGKSEAVQSVESMISSIDAEVSLESGDSITAAEAAYMALEDKEKEKVENYSTLEEARTAYDRCVTVDAYANAVDSYNGAVDQYNSEVNAYNELAQEANTANQEFSDYLSGISDSNIFHEIAYDDTTINDLQEATSNATLDLGEQIDMIDLKESISPEDLDGLETADIDAKTDNLTTEAEVLVGEAENVHAEIDSVEVPDYTDLQAEIQEKWDTAKESVAIQQQITQPSEDFVISRLYTVSDISGVEAVTEDNDPNGQLNKAKGYTAAVYFSVPGVDPSELFGSTIIEQGTDAGGCIEVYTCVEDATTRDTYLSSFDGTALSSGSHMVLGTMVVRTSNLLTGSQQSALTEGIVAAMIILE